MTFLLDTNVVSELRKVRAGKADENVARWAEELETPELFISVITVQELEIAVRLAERRDRRQGSMLRRWLDDHVLPTLSTASCPSTQRSRGEPPSFMCRIHARSAMR